MFRACHSYCAFVLRAPRVRRRRAMRARRPHHRGEHNKRGRQGGGRRTRDGNPQRSRPTLSKASNTVTCYCLMQPILPHVQEQLNNKCRPLEVRVEKKRKMHPYLADVIVMGCERVLQYSQSSGLLHGLSTPRRCTALSFHTIYSSSTQAQLDDQLTHTPLFSPATAP